MLLTAFCAPSAEAGPIYIEDSSSGVNSNPCTLPCYADNLGDPGSWTAATVGSSTTYTYTGNVFTTAYAPFTLANSVSGSFTITTLSPDLLDDPVTPTTFSFSDGVNTFTNTNASITEYFEVSTNASGAITNWDIGGQTTQAHGNGKRA